MDTEDLQFKIIFGLDFDLNEHISYLELGKEFSFLRKKLETIPGVLLGCTAKTLKRSATTKLFRRNAYNLNPTNARMTFANDCELNQRIHPLRSEILNALIHKGRVDLVYLMCFGMDLTDWKRVHELGSLKDSEYLITAIIKLFPQRIQMEDSAQIYLEGILTSCLTESERTVLIGAYKDRREAEATKPREAPLACSSPEIPEQILPIIKNAAVTGPQSEQVRLQHSRHDDSTGSRPVEERHSGSSHKRRWDDAGLDQDAFDKPAEEPTEQRRRTAIISTNINPGDSESAKGIQDFLSSIDRECPASASGPVLVTSQDQLRNHLEGPFLKPLLWESFTSQYPLPADMPTSIPDFLAFLTKINVQQLETIDYVEDAATPKKMNIAEVARYFESCSTSRSAKNFLDIENVCLPCVPVPVHQADLLRLAYLRKRGSVSKSMRNNDAISPGREFLLLSGRNSVSPIHVDTAGQLTWIIGICGRKVWYVPSDINSAANRLATRGSQFPEHYEGGWTRIVIEPGDLFIMPPGCPHAVFTPEDSFTVGGNFYTSSHLGTTIATTALQARYGSTFCNETLSLEDYLNIALILEQHQGLLSSADMARLAASEVYWSVALPLDAHVEARQPATRPRDDAHVNAVKGGGRNGGNARGKKTPARKEYTSKEDTTQEGTKMTDHTVWLQVLGYIQKADAELQKHLTKGDT